MEKLSVDFFCAKCYNNKRKRKENADLTEDTLCRYAGIMQNDVVDGEGISVSFWAQGCPHRCPGCQNPQTWSFNGGKLATYKEIRDKVITALKANNILRNFSLLGGEPLCDENVALVKALIQAVKTQSPKSKVYIWTGYAIEQLVSKAANNPDLWYCLWAADVIIDGPFIESQRDLRLELRGSHNQRILHKGIDF